MLQLLSGVSGVSVQRLYQELVQSQISLIVSDTYGHPWSSVVTGGHNGTSIAKLKNFQDLELEPIGPKCLKIKDKKRGTLINRALTAPRKSNLL
jgi:hypothetical protein